MEEKKNAPTDEVAKLQARVKDLEEKLAETLEDTELELPGDVAVPVIVDLGKVKKKSIKKLKNGQGRLMNEVHDAVYEIQSVLEEEAEGKVFVPIVIIYEKKSNNDWLFPRM